MKLLATCTCPHCWTTFAPEDVLWVSAHTELLGDLRLGPEQQMRFLPSRFDLKGNALDARGFPCRQLACPRCHLVVPRGLLELPPYFMSILGTPSCGKSFYLTALTWQLRRLLPGKLGVAFQDVDPEVNRVLNEHEHALFFSGEGDRLVPMADLIRKTELQGEQYDFVTDGDQVIQYPRPFLFSMQAQSESTNGKAGSVGDRVLCLYDNAGEHFLAGQDSSSTPVTQHLARSEVLFFLFDPLQDPRFRSKYMPRGEGAAPAGHSARQEIVLLEASARIRRLKNLSQKDKIDKPLIVVLTKSDAWGAALKLPKEDPLETARGDLTRFRELVEQHSAKLRGVLVDLCPEIVHSAEGLSRAVAYVPVSALGQSPVPDPASGKPAINPEYIQPVWVTTPFLYALFKFPMKSGTTDKH